MSAMQDRAMASPHRLVRASAGSGKTFQLTNALLRLLLAGEDVGAVLATTFTRAAAGEILHRALARLSDAAVEESALEELREHVDPNLTTEGCAEALERIVGQMHRLSVLTIDAFFARLATSFSLELGLAPGWRMLDEEESAHLQALSVDQTLSGAPDSELIELLRDLQGEGRRTTHAHRAIMNIVGQGYTAYLETGGDESAWSAIGPVGKKLSEEEIADSRESLARCSLPTTKQGNPNQNWEKARQTALEDIGASDWESFVGKGFGKKILEARSDDAEPLYYNAFFPPDALAALEPLIEHARFALTSDHMRRTFAALDLLRRFDGAYTNMKRAAGGVTFDDPPRLLLEAEATGDLAHLYFRLDARIRHVLLDEFQDTSMTQFRLLEPILDEMLSQASEGRSVFCVGDAKQSLYAWREAEPTLLPALKERWPTLIEDTLARSWRSSQAVLDAVNELFGSMKTNAAMAGNEAALSAAEEWDERFDIHEAARANRSGAARLIVAEDEMANKNAALETAADRVAEARRAAPGASIAVLVRRGKDLRAVLGMLKRRGIDAGEQRGNPLVDAPPVAAAASMLRLIDHPGDTAALFHVATSPLGPVVGLDPSATRFDAARIAGRLRRRIAQRGCAGLLAEWYETCAPAMDERGAARFEQFIDLAETFDAAGRAGSAELADIAETRRIDEPGRAPVRVMTIHGAKGLEFDVVVLPLVGSRPWNVAPESVITGRAERLGPVTRVSRYPNETMRLLHPDLNELHSQEFRKQVNEELCCLYVAATRARRCLEMVVPADRAGRKGNGLDSEKWRLSPAHVVRAALAPDAPAEPGATLWETSNGGDWSDDPNLRAAAQESSPSAGVSLSVTPPAARSAARLAGATPSQERGGRAVSAASLLMRREPRGRRIGELVHHWFERIDWLDEASDPDDAMLRRLAEEARLDLSVATDAIAAFRTGIGGASVRSALSRADWMSRSPEVDEARVWNERPFAVRDGDRLLEGRFDRLVVGRSGGRVVRAEVIDFKTDHAAAGLAGEALARHAETHRAQMEAYRRAAAALLSMSAEQVEVALIFTAAGATVRLPAVPH